MVLQVDSLAVACMLQGKDVGSATGRSLILKIRQRMLEFDALQVCHVYRGANMCAVATSVEGWDDCN